MRGTKIYIFDFERSLLGFEVFDELLEYKEAFSCGRQEKIVEGTCSMPMRSGFSAFISLQWNVIIPRIIDLHHGSSVVVSFHVLILGMIHLGLVNLTLISLPTVQFKRHAVAIVPTKFV